MRAERSKVSRRCRWCFVLSALLFTCSGCPPPDSPPSPGTSLESYKLLGPVAIKVHPSSGVMRKAAGGTFDGLAVACEILDRFDDPIKAVGVMRFEAYDFAQSQPERKGPRVGFWPDVRVDSLETIQQHWDGVWGLYRFNLNWDHPFRPGQRFVLEATLTSPQGQQFSSSHILQVHP